MRQHVGLRVEVGFADERRDEREHEQGDQPRGIGRKPDGKRDDRHDILSLCEQLAHQRHATGRLTAGSIEPILQLAVLEVLEIERGCVLHETHARDVGKLLAEQGIEQRNEAPEQIKENRERKLGSQEPQQRIESPTRHPCGKSVGGARRRCDRDHLIDDQLADIEGRDRKHRANKPEQQRCRRERGARLPDECEKWRQVAQGADTLTKRFRRWEGPSRAGHEFKWHRDS